MWKCPRCNAEIDDLSYSVDTSGREYGTACLSDIKYEDSCDIITDHNYDDSGDTEWSGSCEYQCPECEEDICPEDLIWIGDDEEDEDEYDEDDEDLPKDLTNDEEIHNIVKPKKNIISDERAKDTSKSAIVCKNKKCKHIFACDKVNEYDDEIFFECPKCGESNIVEKY